MTRRDLIVVGGLAAAVLALTACVWARPGRAFFNHGDLFAYHWPLRHHTAAALIEGRLALGATRWEAAHPLIVASLNTGMIPTINSMMVMGIVSLPGMMTGQMLAGAAPAAAVRYQIVIMFMIAATTALGTLAVILLAYRRLFNRRHQLCVTRLHTIGRTD